MHFKRLMINHLPEHGLEWQWMAANLPLSIYLHSIRNHDAEGAHHARALLTELLTQDLSRWGPHQRAEVYYVAAVISLMDEDYETALRFSMPATETPGFHHAKSAALIGLSALSHLGRVQEFEDAFVAVAVRFDPSEEELFRWAEQFDPEWQSGQSTLP